MSEIKSGMRSIPAKELAKRIEAAFPHDESGQRWTWWMSGRKRNGANFYTKDEKKMLDAFAYDSRLWGISLNAWFFERCALTIRVYVPSFDHSIKVRVSKSGDVQVAFPKPTLIDAASVVAIADFISWLADNFYK